MATSASAVVTKDHFKVWDCIATADGDTTLVIAHGFGEIPYDVTLLPILQAPAEDSNWSAVVDATNITLTKGTTAGSGNAAAQLRVIANIHSLTH